MVELILHLVGDYVPRRKEGLVSEQVKHTPGPWRIGGRLMIYGADDHLITRVYHNRQFTEAHARPGDVHLIAAAPELLEMLAHARAAIGSLDLEALGESGSSEDSWPLRDELLHRIDQAIAKAEGR